jgi:hypothetical protein
MGFTRKDLILLQKYKDENYKRALVDSVVSLAKHQVFRSAMAGETMARIGLQWAATRKESEELQKEEQQVRDQLKEAFPDSKIEVDTNVVSFIIYEFVEIIVKVNWGS